MTALMRSMCHGAVGATQLLLEHGAVCSRVDNDGRGPLHHAAATGVVPNDSVALLLAPDNDGESALSVDSADAKGCTPLLLAIAHGHLEFAELLLAQYRASTVGSTAPPLHLAAATHQVDMVALLLKYGAPPAATNAQGETALFGTFFSQPKQLDRVRSRACCSCRVSTERNVDLTPRCWCAMAGACETADADEGPAPLALVSLYSYAASSCCARAIAVERCSRLCAAALLLLVC